MSNDKICDGPIGDIGNRILHEDDNVRIWDVDIAPGEDSDIHEHKHDYILVILDGDKIAGVPHVSATGEFANYIEVETKPGDFFVVPKGGVETARNIGTKRYHELVIELKKS